MGYGNGGTEPFVFELDEDRNTDIGFFRLFVSASPANFFRSLILESPFAGLGTRGGEGDGDEEEEEGEDEVDEDKELKEKEEALKKLYADHWGVISVTAVQKRRV